MTRPRPRGVLLRLGAANALLEVQFWFPVWLFFLLDRGFTLTQAVLADGIFRFTVVLAEVPLGRWADKFGRRRTFLTLAGATAVVFVGVSAVHEMHHLVVMWIAWGLVWALASGASGAYLYDLVEHGHVTGRPSRALAFMRASASGAVLVSIAIAGHLYEWGITLPFLATAALAVLALALALSLPHVDGPAPATGGPPPRLREQYASPTLRALLVTASLVLLFGWSAQVLFQPLSQSLGWTSGFTGWVFAGFALSGMVGHVIAGRWKGPPGVPVTAAWAVMVGAVALVAATSTTGALIALPLLGLAAACAGTLIEARLLDQSPLGARATTLGLVSAVAGIGIGIARPALGVVTDHHSAHFAFGVWAVCGVVLTAVFLPVLRRSHVA